MSTLLYHYPRCSTCVKALKYLDQQKINYQAKDITLTPPSKSELKKMLSYLKNNGMKINHLFNTSGVMYRELKIKDILPKMSESEAIELLSQNGKLIKRPFLLTKDQGLVGFKLENYQALFKK
jgi:arsenate reductase